MTGELPPNRLLQRIYSHSPALDGVAPGLTDVVVDGEIVGRAVLVGNSEKYGFEAPVIVGGLRTNSALLGIVEIFVGKSLKAARDEAEPIFSRVR
ncbi:hypothetical protein [Kibdelosporangium phytohabitans]|uniref:hypothetical protein n=1 Tax=Kibdelosporangium phytohabitans TaxID=860235 RepID=UPI0012FBA19D|nr:hypothetical protein [Kibdelosporangium phytohabitans]MBE1469850.1 hypothetical protein [Kibdelosporangium phytohabitans]